MMVFQRACAWLVLFCGMVPTVPAFAAAKTPAHSFTAGRGEFLLDGKPFQVISGEMHYARVPRAYWRDRLRMAKAMGLNSITAYVFWNWHEPEPGVYDFSGNRDVAEFVREAQQEGLYVILRPGPYSCAEWDFGGFPAWLLKDPNMVVRSRDPKFWRRRARGCCAWARNWRHCRLATAVPSLPCRWKTNMAPMETTMSTWKTSTICWWTPVLPKRSSTRRMVRTKFQGAHYRNCRR